MVDDDDDDDDDDSPSALMVDARRKVAATMLGQDVRAIVANHKVRRGGVGRVG